MQVAEVKQLEDQLWEAVKVNLEAVKVNLEVVKVNLEDWLVVVEVT